MKKLVGIVVLGLLLSGNAYAEIIEYKECWVKKSKNLNATKKLLILTN